MSSRDYHHEQVVAVDKCTKNQADLMALKLALHCLKEPCWISLIVFTESWYLDGLFNRGWMPKKHQTLVSEINGLLHGLASFNLIHVPTESFIDKFMVNVRLGTATIIARKKYALTKLWYPHPFRPTCPF
jgi:hypothetical protein